MGFVLQTMKAWDCATLQQSIVLCVGFREVDLLKGAMAPFLMQRNAKHGIHW